MKTKINEINLDSFLEEAEKLCLTSVGQAHIGDCYWLVFERYVGKRELSKAIKEGADVRGQDTAQPLIKYIVKSQKNC